MYRVIQLVLLVIECKASSVIVYHNVTQFRFSNKITNISEVPAIRTADDNIASTSYASSDPISTTESFTDQSTSQTSQSYDPDVTPTQALSTTMDSLSTSDSFTLQTNDSSDTSANTQLMTSKEPLMTKAQSTITHANDVPYATTPLVAPAWAEDTVDTGAVPCDPYNPRDACSYEDFERCVFVLGRAPRCVCMAGYARSRIGDKCIAVKHYQGIVMTEIDFTGEYSDHSSSVFRAMVYDATEGMYEVAERSDLRTLMIEMHIKGLLRSSRGTINIRFEVLIARPFTPSADLVKKELEKGLMEFQQPNKASFLGTTDILLSKSSAQRLTVIEPDPCSDRLLNHCDRRAFCNRTSANFVCSCFPGYIDVSFDKLEASGEACALNCFCENDGECVADTDGQLLCRCHSLFFGSRCQVNGEVLLIAVGSSLGLLLLLLIGLTFRCMRVKRSSASVLSNGTRMIGQQSTVDPRKDRWAWTPTY
ncbi:hypothetical protein CAPTEDRAFT_197289 [Capitella teleta]|uniref:EGF-like domain-containing protein n=1 Tax=Capitella teleta TaxID=283909 RepID=R7U0Q3_CAPTE|nr:hypothetical protein CAPTEDRAFT_197289 [Capitella teleta]|eukprot:ELT99773.1 hypothetical protein CAPTEDRAFT_197289 [Capitella teleta]